MKKLMTVIAAVAMSFGLFAESASHFISFETADECVDENGKLEKAGWEGDASVIDLVGSGYNYVGADARRTEFAGGASNLKCLKLETGKEVVTCTPDGDTDNIFFDQTVKFTGYEEDPTVSEGKIAIWATAIETEGEEGTEGYQAGQTNLYITCGTVDGEGVPTPADKILIRENINIDAWHRVTIKSLGNVVKGGNVAGFIVYIDGTQVVVDAAKGLVDASVVTDAASSYNASGMLFPALASGTVASVAYQGIGELDDVAIDNLGPQFARFVEGSVVAIDGATLALTNTTDGIEIEVGADGKFQVAPGANLLFTYTAVDGNFLTGGKTIATRTGNIGEQTDYDFRDEIESKVAVVKASISEDFIYFASLQEAFDAKGAEELVLQANVELGAADAAITVPAAFNSNLDLNGKSIKRVTGNSYLMVVSAGASLKIKDELETGTIEYYPCALGFTKSPATNTNMDKQVPSSMIKNLGTLKLGDGATLKSDYCCVKNDEGQGVIGDFTMSGGAMEIVPCDGFYGLTFTIMNWGTATITGGSHKGNVQTLADKTNKGCQASTLTIDDGTFDPAEIYLCAYDNEAFPTLFLYDDFEGTLTPVAKPMVDGLNLKVVETKAEEGYTGYTLEEEAAEPDYVTFTVEYNDNQVQDVTVTTNGAAVVAAEGVYTVESNAVVTVAATAKDGFKNVAITGDNVTVTDGEFTADKAESAITITADAMVYAKVPAITGSYTYDGTEQTAVLTTGEGYVVVGDSNKQTNAGEYKVEVALAEGYDAWSDKTTENKDIDWSIAKAAVTVTADNQTIKVGQTPATYTAQVTDGTVYGSDELDYEVACPTYEDKEGTYDIVVTPGTNPNYEVEPINGTLTVQKAEDPLPPWVPEGEKEAYNEWKAGPGSTESDFTGDETAKAKKMEDSFLLNCAPTEAALKTAKDNFVITSITQDADGNWVVLTVGQADQTEYGNGVIKLEAFENVGCTGKPVTPADQTQLFWKASLVHPAAD